MYNFTEQKFQDIVMALENNVVETLAPLVSDEYQPTMPKEHAIRIIKLAIGNQKEQDNKAYRYLEPVADVVAFIQHRLSRVTPIYKEMRSDVTALLQRYEEILISLRLFPNESNKIVIDLDATLNHFLSFVQTSYVTTNPFMEGEEGFIAKEITAQKPQIAKVKEQRFKNAVVQPQSPFDGIINKKVQKLLKHDIPLSYRNEDGADELTKKYVQHSLENASVRQLNLEIENKFTNGGGEVEQFLLVHFPHYSKDFFVVPKSYINYLIGNGSPTENFNTVSGGKLIPFLESIGVHLYKEDKHILTDLFIVDVLEVTNAEEFKRRYVPTFIEEESKIEERDPLEDFQNGKSIIQFIDKHSDDDITETFAFLRLRYYNCKPAQDIIIEMPSMEYRKGDIIRCNLLDPDESELNQNIIEALESVSSEQPIDSIQIIDIVSLGNGDEFRKLFIPHLANNATAGDTSEPFTFVQPLDEHGESILGVVIIPSKDRDFKAGRIISVTHLELMPSDIKYDVLRAIQVYEDHQYVYDIKILETVQVDNAEIFKEIFLTYLQIDEIERPSPKLRGFKKPSDDQDINGLML